MLTAITDIRLVRKLQKEFESKLKKNLKPPRLLSVGFQSGNEIVNVSYSAKQEIWFSFNNPKSDTKFWNASGLASPN